MMFCTCAVAFQMVRTTFRVCQESERFGKVKEIPLIYNNNLNILSQKMYLIVCGGLHCSQMYDIIQIKCPSGQNVDNLNLIRHTISFQKIIVSEIPWEREVAPVLAHGLKGKMK